MPPPSLTARLLTFALAFAGAAFATSSQAQWREIPYDDVVKMALTLQAVDTQHVFRSQYQFRPGKGQTTLPADLQLQLKENQTITPLPILPDGKVAIPRRSDLVGRGVQFRINQPKGRVGLAFDLTARLPPSTSISYGQLTESIPVMERGIASMAGMMRFMAPKPRALLIKFAPGPIQTLQLFMPGGGKQTFASDASSILRLPWNPDWLRGAVVLSAMPLEIQPEIK